MKKPLSSSVLTVTLIAFVLPLGEAKAALTLRIDTVLETYSWTGSSSSTSVTIEFPEALSITAGSLSGSNGLGVGSSDALSSSFAGTGGAGTSSASGQLFVDEINGRLFTPIASGLFSPATGVFTTTGDGMEYSYAALSMAQKTFLASLDGTDLIYQIDDGISNTFVSNAGSVVVVPEPSTALLLGVSALGLAIRRKR